MMSQDKKKLAMLIIGKKEDEKDSQEKSSEDYDDSTMEKEAFEMCMNSFHKALKDDDTEKAVEKFKKLVDLAMSCKEEDEEEDY